MALQRSEEARELFRSTVSIYKPPMLVFLDENGTDRRDAMRRFGYSYSLRGKPARTHKLLVRGKHLTAIAAIHCKNRVVNMTCSLSFWLQMSEPITHMDTDNHVTIHRTGTSYFDSTAHLKCSVQSFKRNDKLSFIRIIAHNIVTCL